MEVQPCQSHRDRQSACFGDSAVSETRELAAILVSDVVGYSRLTGADEDRILARLRTLRSDLIDPTIAAHHGHIVKRTGDGAIVEFRSVVDAVRCAIEVQTGLIERNAGVPEERAGSFARYRIASSSATMPSRLAIRSSPQRSVDSAEIFGMQNPI
jgi:class 3 adenylate cyclase